MLPEQTSLNSQDGRKKRFSRELTPNGVDVFIPRNWDDLPPAPADSHEDIFVDILRTHGITPSSPVPLVGRYSKARRWSSEELEACMKAHDRGVAIGLMSAALNRNPQDIIFRLLDAYSDKPQTFRETSVKTSNKLEDQNLIAARALFEAGLTAWRIAALFGTDFETAEKLLYQGREDYGHVKKNPFAICTDHKQIVNRAILGRVEHLSSVVDAFAGEGRFTQIVNEIHPEATVQCVEKDGATFSRATGDTLWPENVVWMHDDNMNVLKDLNETGQKYDLIDLDPFVSCRDQMDLTWNLLNDRSSLFITFGGEYRRSFIGTNRKAIARRYGFLNDTLTNSDYLEIIPAFFYGWVAQQASKNGFILEIEYCVRYPNYCRFWTKSKKATQAECKAWYETNVEERDSGFFWKDLLIPRFSEVRYRTDELIQGIPYTPAKPKKRKSKAMPAPQMELKM